MVGTQGVKEFVLSTSRGKNSSFTKWTGNIDPLDTSFEVSATQETDSDFSCIEKVVVKSLPDKIVADLDTIIWVNLANSVPSKRTKFINLGLPTFDATGINNIDSTLSIRAKSLNGTQRKIFRDARLGYTHDFERVSKTTAYSNHIKNAELETREVFEQKYSTDTTNGFGDYIT